MTYYCIISVYERVCDADYAETMYLLRINVFIKSGNINFKCFR